MQTQLESRELRGGNFSPSRDWTTREGLFVRANAANGAEWLAEQLERSIASVKKFAWRNEISLRQPGSRRGLIITQSRDVSYVQDHDLAGVVVSLAQFREDVLARRLDPVKARRMLRRQYLIARGAPACPECVTNPQEDARLGLCTDCKLRRYTAMHEQDAFRATSEVQRAYDRARQASKRRGSATVRKKKSAL